MPGGERLEGSPETGDACVAPANATGKDCRWQGLLDQHGQEGHAQQEPAGWRARCAPFLRRHRDVPPQKPASRSRTRRAGCPEGDWPGCPFSWLLLFGQAKRSDPAAAEADGTRPRGRRRRVNPPAVAKPEKTTARSRWIPASAGMTSKSQSKNWIPARAFPLPPGEGGAAAPGEGRGLPQRVLLCFSC